jgi:hypothetical protein
MARPITLFTGQWADLTLDTIAEKAASWGYDGLELACWGDHFEVDKALADDKYCEGRHKILKKHGLQVFAISTHLVGQAVCDNIDGRHKAILPADVWGDHFEVDKAIEDDKCFESRRKMLKKHGLEVHKLLKDGDSPEQATSHMMIRKGPRRYKRWHSSDRENRKNPQGKKFVWKRTRVKIDEFVFPSWLSDWFRKLRVWKWFSPKR